MSEKPHDEPVVIAPISDDSQPTSKRVFKSPQEFRSSPEYLIYSQKSELPFAAYLYDEDEGDQVQGSKPVVIPPKG